MPAGKCPRCSERYVHSPWNTDFVHTCVNAGSALNLESVRVKGNWSDYTGTGSVSDSVTQAAGTANALQFKHEGGNLESLDSRGKSRQVYRERQHLEFIDQKKKGQVYTQNQT